MNEAVEKIREMISKSGSQRAVAVELDISPAYLSDILKGNRGISEQVAKKLGFEWRLISSEKDQK